MNYSIEHIHKAFELAEIPEDFANRIIEYLPEAVRLLNTIHAETLSDFFGQFCILNSISESELRSRKRDENLVKLRKKYCILAKERFPEHSSVEIGREIDRDGSTVRNYFDREKTRKEKRDNLERMKNEFKLKSR